MINSLYTTKKPRPVGKMICPRMCSLLMNKCDPLSLNNLFMPNLTYLEVTFVGDKFFPVII